MLGDDVFLVMLDFHCVCFPYVFNVALNVEMACPDGRKEQQCITSLPWAFVKVAMHLQSIVCYNHDFCDGSVTIWLKGRFGYPGTEVLRIPRFVVVWSIDTRLS